MWLTREELPKAIVIDDREYPVDTDFRSWIRVALILEDPNIDDRFKLPIISTYLNLDDRAFMKETEENIFNGLLIFFNLGREPKKSQSESKEVAYKYDYDWPLILSAFRQQYQIDLLTEDLHWFEFKSMFDAIGKPTLFNSVMGWRVQDISKLPKGERESARKLKEYWRTPDVENIKKGRDPKDIEAEIMARIRR